MEQLSKKSQTLVKAEQQSGTDTTFSESDKVPAALPPERLAAREKALKSYLSRSVPFEVKVVETTGDVLHLAPDWGGDVSHELRKLSTFGTRSNSFASQMLGRLAAVVREPNEAMPRQERLNAGLVAVQAVAPENELEAMLAVQMYATHEVAMEMLTRAKHANHGPALINCSTIATKLLRTYTAQIEALAKLRRGCEQRVIVKHVHVYEGGQAVVGSVDVLPGGTVGRQRKQRATP